MNRSLKIPILSSLLILTSQAHAINCEEIFETPLRSRPPSAAPFIPNESPLNTVGGIAMLMRVRQALPEGKYNVLVNGIEPSVLTVSYSAIDQAEFRLGKVYLGRTESIPLTASDLPELTGSVSGRDAWITIENGSIILVNSTYSGSERTYAGLIRRDTALRFNFSPTGDLSITVDQGLQTISYLARPFEPYSKETKIEIKSPVPEIISIK